MKNLIYLIVFLTVCNPYGVANFNVTTMNRHILDEIFIIKDGYTILAQGKLPLSISASKGTYLTAEFEANVSNFGSNHPDCNCEYLAFNHFDCKEKFTVNGKDWEIADESIHFHEQNILR